MEKIEIEKYNGNFESNKKINRKINVLTKLLNDSNILNCKDLDKHIENSFKRIIKNTLKCITEDCDTWVLCNKYKHEIREILENKSLSYETRIEKAKKYMKINCNTMKKCWLYRPSLNDELNEIDTDYLIK